MYQLQKGAHLIDDQEERIQVAQLAALAAERASGSSCFALAADYLDLGTRMLPTRNWRDEYHLSLKLFNASVEAHYALGKFDRARSLLDEIQEHARNEDDKILSSTLSIYLRGSSHDLDRAIDEALVLLSSLGEVLPRWFQMLRWIHEFTRVKRVLKNLSDSDLLALPALRNDRQEAVARLLVMTYTYLLLTQPILSLLASLRLVRHGLEHGLSGMSAAGFAALGLVMCTVLGDVDAGIRYATLSLRILEKYGSIEWLPRVYTSIYGFSMLWKISAQETMLPMMRSHRIAMGTGDIETSLLSAGIYASSALLSSQPLRSVEADMASFVNLCNIHKQEAMKQVLLPNYQFALSMLGKSDNPLA